MTEFRWPVRVYWEDTDAGGVVYHATYLQFLERARTEWLRAAGISQSELAEQANRVFVVSRMQLHFRAPARLDDALEVGVALEKVGKASLQLAQTIRRRNQLLLQASVRVACVTADQFKPVPVPRSILERLDR